jgi:catechol 2,3-dioxygenase-like lactoylglutathione lyase family enzyme
LCPPEPSPKIPAVLGSAALIAFIGTADLARARAFYEGVLGLPVIEDEPGVALAVDARGTMLRVTAVREVAPRPYTVLGWAVPDVAAAVRHLAARGVPARRFDGLEQDDLGIWSAPGGARVAWFADPDGNTLSVAQFPGPPAGATTFASAADLAGALRRAAEAHHAHETALGAPDPDWPDRYAAFMAAERAGTPPS